MKRNAPFGLILMVLSVGLAQACLASPQPTVQSKRILILTGEDYPGHKWQETAPVLKSIYAQDPRFAVDVVEDLSTLSSVNFKAYDAVVMHFKNYDPNVPGRKGFDNLTRFVQQGGGLVLVHFACGAFQEFKDDFTQLAGRAWNPALRGHDPFGEFTVTVTDKTHPIMAGMQDFTLTDELYTCLEGDVPIKVLASATSKVDKKVYPMAFVLAYGKGRVFHSVLGHDVNALSNQGAAELYRRGTAWTAGMVPVK